MRPYFVLLAALVLPGTASAQDKLSQQQVRQLLEQYNPALMQQARQNVQLNKALDGMMSAFVQEAPLDTLENRYTFIALVRNFANSLLITNAINKYQDAVLYCQQGGDADIQLSAWQATYDTLLRLYARVWAVSVQVKEALLKDYNSYRGNLKRDKTLTEEQQKIRIYQLDNSIAVLKEDLKQLHDDVGNKLVLLVRNTLDTAQAQVVPLNISARQEQQAKQAANLQIKTNHKKPVAE